MIMSVDRSLNNLMSTEIIRWTSLQERTDREGIQHDDWMTLGLL